MRSPTNEDQFRRLTSAPPLAREALATVLGQLLTAPDLHDRLEEGVVESLAEDDLEGSEAVAEADELLNVLTKAMVRASPRGRTRYRVEDRDVRGRGER